jgi:hypothetical protein
MYRNSTNLEYKNDELLIYGKVNLKLHDTAQYSR